MFQLDCASLLQGTQWQHSMLLLEILQDWIVSIEGLCSSLYALFLEMSSVYIMTSSWVSHSRSPGSARQVALRRSSRGHQGFPVAAYFHDFLLSVSLSNIQSLNFRNLRKSSKYRGWITMPLPTQNCKANTSCDRESSTFILCGLNSAMSIWCGFRCWHRQNPKPSWFIFCIASMQHSLSLSAVPAPQKLLTDLIVFTK